MVRITRSFTWEDFRKEFLYDWIEKLSILDQHYDAKGTSRLLGLLILYTVSVICFTVACLLMLFNYRRVDPRCPSMPPQPLTIRELFLDIPQKGRRYGKYTTADISVEPAVGQPSKSASSQDAELISSGTNEPIVASSTPLLTPTHGRSLEEPIVATTTPITKTPGVKKSAEGVQGGTPVAQVPSSTEIKITTKKSPPKEGKKRSSPPEAQAKTKTKVPVAQTQGSGEAEEVIRKQAKGNEEDKARKQSGKEQELDKTEGSKEPLLEKTRCSSEVKRVSERPVKKSGFGLKRLLRKQNVK